MTKYLYHLGTGTLIDLNDNCVVIDDERLDLDADDPTALDEIARKHGLGFTPDAVLNPDLIVSFTPGAILCEAEEGSLFEAGVPDHIIEWLKTADHDTLRTIGSIAIAAEEVWTAWTEALGFAIQDAYLAATKEEGR
jgi:hypothetical protein